MRRTRLFLAAAGVLTACTGAIEETTQDPGGGSYGGGDRPIIGADGRPIGPLPATVIRRLTRTEYNFTVRDLLGDTSNPGDLLPADGVSDFGLKVFDNNATGLKIDETAFETYETLAEQIVDRAM